MAKQEEIRADEEARGKHRSDWVKAEYETMGWDKKPDILEQAYEPYIPLGESNE